jgi:hypothetical protein
LADYDLGTAHGKIEIESDTRGTAQAIRQLAELKAAAAQLDRSFADTRNSLENFSRNIEAVGASSDSGGRRVGGLSGRVKTLGSDSDQASGGVSRLNIDIQKLAELSISAGQRVGKLHGEIQKFTSLSGVLGNIAGKFTDVDDVLAKAPQWQRNIVNASKAIATFGAASGILRGVTTSFAGMIASTAAFGFIAPRVRTGITAIRGLLGAAALMSPAFATAGVALRGFATSIGFASRGFAAFAGGVGQATRGASQMVLGALLLQKGLAGIATAAKFAVLGMGGIAVAAAGLQVIGTVVLGAANAIKTMSGAALLAPGALAAIGITVGVAKVAFKGMGDAFKASALDGKEFDDAIKKLSPEMQNAARAAHDMKGKFSEIRDVAQLTALSGFANDIKLVGNTYVPTLERGVSAVGTSLARVRSGFKDFLLQPATINDVNSAFGNTRTILDNLSRAVWPFLAALRDIGSVGLEVLTGISNGAGQAAARFANFISEARKTGELKTFITDGVQAFKDLGSTLASTGRAITTIFEAFGASGDNSLARLSRSAKTFDDAMKKSASGGSLQTIADSFKRISSISLTVVVTALQQVMAIVEKLAPFAAQLQESFGAGLVTAFTAVGTAAQFFASVISNIPGLGSFLGSLLAVTVALKAMALLFSPIVRAIQILVGAFNLLRGVVNSIAGINAALTTMEARGGAAAAAATRVKTAIVALQIAAGALIVTLAAVTVAWLAIDSANQNAEAGIKRVAERQKELKDETNNLVEALTSSGGALSKNVFEVISTDVKNMVKDMQAASDQTTSTWQGAGASLETLFTHPGQLAKSLFDGISGDSKKAFGDLKGTALEGALSMKATGEAAEKAASQIQQTGLSAEAMGRLVVGSDSDLQILISALAKTDNGGREASIALKQLRDESLPLVESMARLGPDAISLSEAMKTLGDAGSSAADKMSALRTALQSLGILESSAEEAMFNIAKAVQEISNSGSGFKEGGGFGQDLLTDLGKLNGASANAVILRDKLKDLGDQLIQVASSGGDITAAFFNMGPAFEKLGADSGLGTDKIMELGRSFGLVPDTLKVLVEVAGKDAAVAELTSLSLQAQQLGTGTHEITMVMKDQDAINALQTLGIQVQEINKTTGEVKVNVDTAQITNLQILISQLKNGQPITIPAPKVDQPVVPVPAPPTTQPNVPAPKVDVPTVPQPVPPTTLPIIPAPAVTQPVVPVPAAPIIPPVPAPTVDKPVIPQPDPPAPIAPISVQIQGVEGVVAGLGSVTSAVHGVDDATSASVGKWNDYAAAITTAINAAVASVNTAVASIGTALAGAASGANASGQALGQGFADGISSKIAAVSAAALALANAAAAPLPRSPALTGPFSGSGWTPFRGKKLAEGFAEGILAGAATTKDAGVVIAASVSDALDSVMGLLGKPKSLLGANRIPGAGGSLFVRDTTKTDADLAKARSDKQAAAAVTAEEDARFKESDAAKKAAEETSSAADKTSNATDKITGSMEDLAKQFDLTITSNKRNEPGSFHNTGEAFDFSGTAENMAKFNDFVAKNDPKARELFFDPGTNIKNGAPTSAIGGHTDHVHYVPSKKTEKASETLADNSTKIAASATDSQQGVVDAIVAEGKRRGLSDTEISAGVAAGIVESNLTDNIGGPDGSVNVFQQRPSQGWGPATESVATDAGQFFDKLAQTDKSKPLGDRIQDVQRSAFPSRYAQQLSKAQTLTEESLKRQGNTLDGLGASSLATQENSQDTANNTDIMAKKIKTGDSATDEAIKALQSGTASDEEVIRALQTIDDTIASTPDRTTHDDLKSLEEAVMTDRGIKKFDPNEGASTDPVGDTIKVVQSIVGLFDTIEGGLTAATTAAEQLIRGFSSTKDVNNFVDSVQSVASTVGSIISTVSEIISTVASLAALAGAAIPGVGQIAAVASAVTGGIGGVNSVIDTVQQVFKIIGRFVGGALSSLAGGANGPLMGDVKILLDTNDNTIKTWSEDNPDDKRVHSLSDPFATQTQNNQTTTGVGQLQVFAGPGDDPNKVMADAMFAVRAAQIGAGAYG